MMKQPKEMGKKLEGQEQAGESQKIGVVDNFIVWVEVIWRVWQCGEMTEWSLDAAAFELLGMGHRKWNKSEWPSRT
jgi:hypothetical protein